MWSKRLALVDWLSIGAALAMAGITTLAISNPIVSTDIQLFLAIGWWMPAVMWSISLLSGAPIDRVHALAGTGLLVAFAAFIPGLPFLLVALTLFGYMTAMVALVAGLGLFAVVLVRARERRAAWLVAPAVVMTTLALGYAGLSRVVRVALGEASLNTYAIGIDRADLRAEPRYFDRPIHVGGLPIYEAYEEDGIVHFVTGYVGILSDDGAGIALIPGEPPQR